MIYIHEVNVYEDIIKVSQYDSDYYRRGIEMYWKTSYEDTSYPLLF